MQSTITSPSGSVPLTPEGPSKSQLNQQRRAAIIIAIVVVVVLGLIITSLVLLLHPNTPEAYVARIRDVFIIIMAFESLLIGAVLVLLILQLAKLTNLLQNEIKPILDSTNETISTLRGTTTFIGNNLSEPIIRLNEILAGLMKILEIFRLGKRK